MPATWLDEVVRQTRRLGDYPYPHWAAVLLNNPIRRRIGRPGAVIERLDLTGSERVLELGPGPGCFSVELARRLPDGGLDLFDLQPQMLEKARRALDGAGCRGVGFHVGDASAQLPFSEATFDVAFLAAVLGEVPDKRACVRSLGRVLRPGGLLVFVEGLPDPDRLSVATLRDLVEGEGFVFEGHAGSAWRDIVRFRRTPTADRAGN
jgi:SAM-dependent methyltransferase